MHFAALDSRRPHLASESWLRLPLVVCRQVGGIAFIFQSLLCGLPVEVTVAVAIFGVRDKFSYSGMPFAVFDLSLAID